MRLTLSSEGAATEKAFKTETIKPRVVFTPGRELKSELSVNSYESVRKTEEAEKDKKKMDLYQTPFNPHWTRKYLYA